MQNQFWPMSSNFSLKHIHGLFLRVVWWRPGAWKEDGTNKLINSLVKILAIIRVLFSGKKMGILKRP